MNFKSTQIKAITKLFVYAPNDLGFNRPEKFVLKFIFFEALIRIIGEYYRERNITKKKILSSHEPINIMNVRRSLEYFSIRVSDQLLNSLLDSSLVKRSQKSARNLRNGLVHQWKIEDLREVEERYDILNDDLVKVINEIKLTLK